MKQDRDQGQLPKGLLESALPLRHTGWVRKADLGLEGPTNEKTQEHLCSSFLLMCVVPRGSCYIAMEDSVEIGRKQAAFPSTFRIAHFLFFC